MDGSGASYVTGHFDGSSTFGAGEANETTLTSAGYFDIFVAKYDADGDLLWVKGAGGGGYDGGSSIAVDGNGASYITGDFESNATFGAGESNETTLSNTGLWGDIFVAKFDTASSLLWANGVNGDDGDGGLGIAVDGSGASYVTGQFVNGATFGTGEPNETTLASTSVYNPEYS